MRIANIGFEFYEQVCSPSADRPRLQTTNRGGSLYSEARCGLFHNGMVKGKIIINNSFDYPIEFSSDDIKINPKKLLNDIVIDFNNFINEINTNLQTKTNFNRMFTNLR